MGLRTRLKKTFSSSSSSKQTSDPESVIPNEVHYTGRKDIQYYKPHEIPRSKYRGKVDPEHSASLAAFSLSDAFSAPGRRTSLALSGTFSPGGTNAQSRAASRIPSTATSRRQSFHDQPGSALRIESTVSSEGSGSSDRTSREKSVGASTVLDHDTASTSLSSQPTAIHSAHVEPDTKLAQHDSGVGMSDIVLTKQTTAHDTPFTAEELEQAMSRASLRPRGFDMDDHGAIGIAS